mmetsp:Transcript_9740/g.36600  ORF Transcript_9740/g.36600 Transcript_9740/m.36600 type:complete len:336 (+) Transcript_9740:315-1322(+)
MEGTNGRRQKKLAELVLGDLRLDLEDVARIQQVVLGLRLVLDNRVRVVHHRNQQVHQHEGQQEEHKDEDKLRDEAGAVNGFTNVSRVTNDKSLEHGPVHVPQGADDIFPEADEPGEAEADPEDQEEREEDRKVADHSEDGANVRACHLEEGQELERPGEEQEDDDHERVRHAALVRKRRAVYAVHPDGHEDKRGNRDGHGVDRELDAIPEVGPVLLDLDVVAEVLAAHELRVEVLQELLAEVLDGNADEKDREDDHANLRVDPGALELEGDGEGDEDAQVHEVLEEVEERATPGERIPAKLEVVEDELVLQELVHLAVDDLLDDAIHAVDVVSVI